MRRRLQLATLLVTVCLLAGCSSVPVPFQRGAARTAAASPKDFAAWVASRSAVVVDISTLRIGGDAREGDADLEFAPEHDFADRLAWPLPARVQVSEIRDLASGVILTPDGFILTSAHVVAHVDEAQVRLDDGRRFNARLVGSDRQSDVALLKIDAENLPVAVIGNSAAVARGDWVAAIGAPFGFHGSVTTGVVSAKERFIAGAGEIPFIQTDVAINPGSSGGPLFNAKGEVVAINSLIYSGSGGYMGLSFAVPINLAMQIAQQLRAFGTVRRARLGAEFQEMTPMLAQSFGLPKPGGALVVRVDAAGAAQRAGLRAGDVLMAIDGKPLRNVAELVQEIGGRAPGSRARLSYWRAGVTQAAWATLSEQAGERAPAASAAPAEPSAWNDGLGLALAELSMPLRRQLGLEGGLVVRESTGLARSEGIRVGDLLVAVNEQPLASVEDFRTIVAGLPPGRTVALLILRDRRLAYMPVRVGAPAGSP